MKVGILVDELIQGGIQKVAIMEAKYLKRLGYDVTLVVLHRIDDEGYQDLLLENEIRVLHLSERLPYFLKLNFRIPFFAFFSFFHILYPFFVHRFIRDREFDAFVSHGTYTALSSISISRKVGIPYICFVHDSVTYILKQKYKDKFLGNFLSILLPLGRMVDNLIIRNAKYIIAFPEMIEEMKKIAKNYDRYQEIHNGCEIIEEDQLHYTKAFYAIAATKWDSGKNFQLLIDVWKRLKKKIPLKIVGSFARPEIKEEYVRKINKAGLSSYIKIVGRVSENELSSFYKDARFLIHPCREAFGMTILEASAYGCPAIFTRNSGVAKLFSDNISLELPHESNVDDYIAYIERLMSLSATKYTDLIREYLKVAKENNWEHHCKQIALLLESASYG